MNVQSVLVVERDSVRRGVMSALLRTLGYHVMAAPSAESATEVARDRPPEAVLIGNVRPDGGREKIAERLQIQWPETTVSLVPLHLDRADGQISLPPAGATSLHGGDRLVGGSPSMRSLRRTIAQAAACDSSILITGETGTGKELVAELIHSNSPRSKGPLVALNCSAFPESLLESELFGCEKGAFTGAVARRAGMLAAADKGTVFMDEIGEMSPSAQAKLLRVIESRSFYPLGATHPVNLDVRFVSATNEDLDRSVETKRFRQDLFYRLNVIRIEMPPLRDRPDDIPLLCRHYIAELNLQFGTVFENLSKESMQILLEHDWPGNVRELRNTLEAAFVLSSKRRLPVLDLPAQIAARLRAGHDRKMWRIERDRVVAALATANGNKNKAARSLSISRMTLYRKIRKFSIDSIR